MKEYSHYHRTLRTILEASVEYDMCIIGGDLNTHIISVRQVEEANEPDVWEHQARAEAAQ